MSMRITLSNVLVRVVPAGFILGACMELFMIKVRIGKESFYETALRLEAQRRAEREEELLAARNRLRNSNASRAGE
jgi:Uncharacterised protein family UPF0640